MHFPADDELFYRVFGVGVKRENLTFNPQEDVPAIHGRRKWLHGTQEVIQQAGSDTAGRK